MKNEKVWIIQEGSTLLFTPAGTHEKKTAQQFRDSPGAVRIRNWMQEQQKGGTKE